MSLTTRVQDAARVCVDGGIGYAAEMLLALFGDELQGMRGLAETEHTCLTCVVFICY